MPLTLTTGLFSIYKMLLRNSWDLTKSKFSFIRIKVLTKKILEITIKKWKKEKQKEKLKLLSSTLKQLKINLSKIKILSERVLCHKWPAQIWVNRIQFDLKIMQWLKSLLKKNQKLELVQRNQKLALLVRITIRYWKQVSKQIFKQLIIMKMKMAMILN